MKGNEKAAAKRLIRSYLDRESVSNKYYITPLIITTVVVAMTIFKSVYAYNLALFASPVLLVVVWVIYIAAKEGEVEVSVEKGLSSKFAMIYCLIVIGLLAGFGHWWLATCWLFIWIAAYLYRCLREDKRKEMETEA